MQAPRPADVREQHQARLLDLVDDGVVGTDADFRITHWNLGAERLYGSTAAQVLGLPVRDVLSFIGDDQGGRLAREVLQHGRSCLELTGVRHDGTPVEVEIVVTAVRDEAGSVRGSLGIHRDTTQRRRTARRLERVRDAERRRIARALHDEALQDLRYALARADDPPDGSPRDDVLVGALMRIGRELHSAVDDLRPADDERPLGDPPLSPAPAEGAPVRVLLVEDHAAVREAFAVALRREPDLEVVGEAGTLAEARGMLAEVDVALVDLRLPDGDGSDLVAALREAEPSAHAIVLSAGPDRSAVARAVERGAAGALSKADRLPDVIDAIRRVGAGEPLLPLDEVVELLRFAGRERERELLDRRAIESLTSRELEILQLIADGCDSRDAASRLHISVRTQRNHVANILGKLGVHSQLQALIFALRHQLVELVPRGAERPST